MSRARLKRTDCECALQNLCCALGVKYARGHSEALFTPDAWYLDDDTAGGGYRIGRVGGGPPLGHYRLRAREFYVACHMAAWMVIVYQRLEEARQA